MCWGVEQDEQVVWCSVNYYMITVTDSHDKGVELEGKALAFPVILSTHL